MYKLQPNLLSTNGADFLIKNFERYNFLVVPFFLLRGDFMNLEEGINRLSQLFMSANSFMDKEDYRAAIN